LVVQEEGFELGRQAFPSKLLVSSSLFVRVKEKKEKEEKRKNEIDQDMTKIRELIR
jgi:hypothetical protein